MFANAYFTIPVGAMESGGGGGTGTGDAMLQEPLDLPPNVTPEVTYTSLINEPTARRVKRFKSNNAYISVANSISDGCCAVTFNPGTLVTSAQIVPGSTGKAADSDRLGGQLPSFYTTSASTITAAPSPNQNKAAVAVLAETANSATSATNATTADNALNLGGAAANLYALKTDMTITADPTFPSKAAVAVLAETATLATSATNATNATNATTAATATNALSLGGTIAADYAKLSDLTSAGAVIESGTNTGYAANADNSMKLGSVNAINYRWSSGPMVEVYSTTTPVSAEKDIGAVVVLNNVAASSFTIRNFAVDVADTLYTAGSKQRNTNGVGCEMTVINKGVANVQLTPSGTLTVTLTSRGSALKLMPNGAAYCVQISPTEIYISGALIP